MLLNLLPPPLMLALVPLLIVAVQDLRLTQPSLQRVHISEGRRRPELFQTFCH